MTPGVRYIIIGSAALLIIVTFALSGQVLPLSEQQWITKPRSSSDITGPAPKFVIIVTPLETQAHPGDPLNYELTVIPDEGFYEPISLQIDIVSVPVFRGSYDLGVLKPPYPGPYKYRVVVPEQAPAPLTVKGTLHARGGDHLEVVELVLFITP
jgi:hypothetical protein